MPIYALVMYLTTRPVTLKHGVRDQTRAVLRAREEGLLTDSAGPPGRSR